MIKLFKCIWDKIFKRRIKKYKKTIILEGRSATKAQKDTIIIIKKNGTYAWAKMYCPCGCGSEIALSLNRKIEPYWYVKITNDGKYKVTISPSIFLTGSPCKSHFFIKDNKVDWV
jgi:hypothetical protein